MRKLLPAVFAVMVLVLAGCSADQTPAADPTPAAATSAAIPPDASAAASSPSADATPEVAVEKCLSGTYHLARFVSLGESQTYGTGDGGDVTVAFNGGSYVMRGAGKEPIQLTLAAQQAQLGVDGTVKGSLTTDGYQGTFTVDRTTGSATLRSGVQQQRIAMSQAANVLAPKGTAALVCSTTTLIMVFDTIRLELER